MDVTPEIDRSAASGGAGKAIFTTACGVVAAVAMCLAGFALAIPMLRGGAPLSARFAWDSFHGEFHVGLDPLSAFFLLPILVVSPLAAVYGGGYLMAYRGRKSLAASWLFFNLFVAGMIMVVIARTALVFLMSWEIMSLSAYFLVTFEDEKAEARRAGWIYLVATHLGAACLLAMFLILGGRAGGLDFDAFGRLADQGPVWSGVIFVLALVGFGAKAGLVPIHVWLPEAHPAAPSHVSALMSGVMIKMGFYGLLRIVGFLGRPAPWWGQTLAGVGLMTALVAVALALQQRDVKRVLAYSSIENMGLIVLALGVGLWAWARGAPALAVLAVSAALLHVWNHALMKSLMFLTAGSVLHGTDERDIETMGGLMKRMPWTGAAMMVGAVAIAALPPLNGFVSEWLMYLSLLKWGLATNGGGLPALLAVSGLALVGGLAAIVFVRLTGIALLGSPRSSAAAHAHESSVWMLAPMAVLVVLCLGAAMAPALLARLLAGAVEQITRGADGAHAARELVELPLETLGWMNALVIAVVAAAAGGAAALTRARAMATGPIWGCGYAAPSARIQYTGGSFAATTALKLLPRSLRPRTSRTAPRGLFPGRAEFLSASPDPVTSRVYEPLFEGCGERFSRLRILQQGKVNVYLGYMVIVLLAALAWAALRGVWGPS